MNGYETWNIRINDNPTLAGGIVGGLGAQHADVTIGAPAAAAAVPAAPGGGGKAVFEQTSYQVYTFDVNNIYGFNPTDHRVLLMADDTLIQLQDGSDVFANTAGSIEIFPPDASSIGGFLTAQPELVLGIQLNGSGNVFPISGWGQGGLTGLTLPPNGGTTALPSVNDVNGTQKTIIQLPGMAGLGLMLVAPIVGGVPAVTTWGFLVMLLTILSAGTLVLERYKLTGKQGA